MPAPIYVFDYAAWSALFPEFSTTVDESQADIYFQIATTFVRNDGGGPVRDPATQQNMLNFVVAHLAFLYSGTADQPAAQAVGRISSATQGSVSIGTDYGNNVSQSMAFWVQSKYGASFWALSAQYRTARYLARPTFPGIGAGAAPFGVVSPWLTGGKP